MAIATDSDTRATSDGAASDGAATSGTAASVAADPGLRARMAVVSDGLAALVADLRPELLMGADAASLYAEFARLERLVGAGKTVLAPRIAESGHWEHEGHRSPESLLATLEGGSLSGAKRTLTTGRRLEELPATDEALRRGALSPDKAATITEAATLDPATEHSLLAGSDTDLLSVVRDRCRRAKATSAAHDPLAAYQRIYASRHFSSWTDEEGAFCFKGRDTADRGAKLLAALTPVVDRLREDHRVAAHETAASAPPGSPAPTREGEGALRADALSLLVTGRGGTPGTGTASDAGDTAGDTSESTSGDTSESTAPGRPVPADPPAMVMVRVDLDALRRGHALPGEQCELDGQSPIPVEVVRHLLDDSFLAYVFTQAGDIKAISHQGRTINRRLRTALAFRDRCCVVPDCHVAYGLEIDHVIPLEYGGPTELANLALLCHWHHRQKTYEGWTLTRTGPSDEDPRWTFTPLPPFGQEPDLGADRRPELGGS